MEKTEHRIISLIASSTETICALGYQDQLVGRSHECDYPESVSQLPVCSEPKFDIEGTSEEIDKRVLDTLKNALSVYRVHVEELKKLEPTVIVTQDHCEVCAVSLKDVENAVCEVLSTRPKIVSLAPNNLRDMFSGIVEIAKALGDEARGLALARALENRIQEIRETVSGVKLRPRVACIEWIEPLMAAGNWVPELVEMAGGVDTLGIAGEHTPRIPIEKLVEADPDLIVVMPCGWDIEKTRSEMQLALQSEKWSGLRAVREGRLYLTDGNQFFNRPGPRLVESLEILTEIFHPETVNTKHKGTGWTVY